MRQTIRYRTNNKAIKNAIKSHFWKVNGSAFCGRVHELDGMHNLPVGQHVATVSADVEEKLYNDLPARVYRRTWKVFLTQTDGTMRTAHHHSEFRLYIEQEPLNECHCHPNHPEFPCEYCSR